VAVGGEKAPGGGKVKGHLFLCIFFTSAFSLAGQQYAPEDPGIVLPPVLLEIEDISAEQVDAELPEIGALPAEEFEVPLPEPPEIEVPIELLALEKEDGVSAPAGDEGVKESEPASFFSSGRIGLGNMNHIIGDVSLYKLGLEPHFYIQFIHERYDGYNFRPPGAGFFHQHDILNGNFSLRSEATQLDVSGNYGESSDGLQGLVDRSSFMHRTIWGGAKFTVPARRFVSFDAELQSSWSEETVSGTDPINSSEIIVSPFVKGRFHFTPLTLTLSGEYEVRFTTGAQTALHRIGTSLGADLEFDGDLNFGGKAGIDWNNIRSLDIPFSVYFRKGFSGMVDLSIRGGYEREQPSYYNLWQESSFYRLDPNQPFPETVRWFAATDVDWYVRPLLSLSGSVEFSRYLQDLRPEENYDPESGMLLFTQAPAFLLQTTVEARWESLDWFSFHGYWEGSFLDVNPLLPVHTLGIFLELRSRNGKWSGGLTGELPVYGTIEMPEIGAHLSFAPTTGVEFSLRGKDLLSPVMAENRTIWGFYETPGLSVLFTTSISL
jgi:hypothetical protein